MGMNRPGPIRQFPETEIRTAEESEVSPVTRGPRIPRCLLKGCESQRGHPAGHDPAAVRAESRLTPSRTICKGFMGINANLNCIMV